MNKTQLIRFLVNEHQKREEYLDSIPTDIRQSVFDNAYVTSIGRVNDALISKLFGEKAESIFWFMYEWEPGYKESVDGKDIIINNTDDFIDFLWDTK